MSSPLLQFPGVIRGQQTRRVNGRVVLRHWCWLWPKLQWRNRADSTVRHGFGFDGSLPSCETGDGRRRQKISWWLHMIKIAVISTAMKWQCHCRGCCCFKKKIHPKGSLVCFQGKTMVYLIQKTCVCSPENLWPRASSQTQEGSHTIIQYPTFRSPAELQSV
jgi:hypothetical protein